MTAKVSVVVPCFGVESFLDRCLNSIVNQTLKDIEIILVDDKSPDRVPQICDNWANRDKRIKVIHKPINEGLGFARNTGLAYATGEFIAFVDSDDFIDKDMYKTLYETAIEHQCDAVFCGFKKEGKRTVLNVQECDSYTEYTGNELNNLIPDFIANKPFEKNEYVHDMSVWHAIYKKSILDVAHIVFVSERDFVSEDIPFQIDFLRNATKIAFIPDMLYQYCFNEGSLTKQVNIEKFEKAKALYELLKTKTSDYDKNSLRAKRLFIGYTRSMIRCSIKGCGSFYKALHFIKNVLNDNVWVDLKKQYPPHFLPIQQRIFSHLIYHKYFFLTYLYAYLMEIAKR